jgi:3-dehydroquinate synthase
VPARPSVAVRHATGSYPVFVESGLLTDLAGRAAALLPGRRLAVITDRTVGRLVAHNLEVPTLVVAPGEASKSRARWSTLTDRLLDLGYARDTAIVAVGGGVVGDLAGFVAASYLRGVPWLQVPTSLIAMVDASVGGKTGLNTRHGKNLVGAFHPPVAVLADPVALRSLHREHLGAGLVEALKHGLIADPDYFVWIERNATGLLAGDPGLLTELVTRSVTIKAAIVGEDEREAGRRAILNAGHTVAHAIEQVTRYSELHGNAVAIGLVTEAMLAHRLGLADSTLPDTLRQALGRLGRPTSLHSKWEASALLGAMSHDKKVRAEALRFSLPKQLGVMAGADSNWTVPATREMVGRVLASAGAATS